MAIQFGRVPIITEPVMDMQMMVQLVNFRIDELNRALHEVELEISKIEGLDNNTPTFYHDVNLQGLYRIKNVMRSKDPQDVVTRRELEELGLFNLDDSSSFATTEDLESAISGAIDTSVATSVDGQIFVREDAVGVNGTTAGTIAMGVDGQGKARPIEIREGQLPVYDSELRELIKMLIEEVRLLREN